MDENKPPDDGATAQSGSGVAIEQNLSAEKDQRGHQSVKFNLMDAYHKKMVSRARYESKVLDSINSSRKWKFDRSCMVSFGKNYSFKIDEVHKSLKEALNEAEYSAIVEIGQYASTKNWQIRFNEESAFKSSINRQIKIGESTTRLIDANEFGKPTFTPRVYTMTSFFRVHWLPYDFCVNDIAACVAKIAPKLTVMGITKEKTLFNDQITNGIYKVKVEYVVDHIRCALDLAGLQEVAGLCAFFQLCGMPPKCLGCKEFGHIRKDCGKSKLKCTKCDKTGHEAKECTLAKRLSEQVNFDDVYEDEIVETPIVPQATNVEQVIIVDQVIDVEQAAVVEEAVVFKIPNTAHKPPTPPKPAKNMQSTADKTPVEVKQEETVAARFSKLQASSAVEAQKRATAAIKKAEKRAALKEKVLNKAISDLEEKKKLSRDAAIQEFDAMNAASKREFLKRFSPPKGTKRRAGSKVDESSAKASKSNAEDDSDMSTTSLFSDYEQV